MALADAPSDDPLVHVDNVVAGYVPEVNILNGCSLELQSGELIGIIGPNGAGKSTVLKALFGLLPVRTGTVMYRGEDVTGQKANTLVAKGVGYVPQINNVFPSLTVSENLEMGGYLLPWRRRRADRLRHRDVPAAWRADRSTRRLVVGWRTSDARDGAGDDDGAQRAAARRAERRSIAAAAGPGVRTGEAGQRGRRVDHHGRAERGAMPADLRPGLRARPRPQRLHRHRHRADDRSEGHRALPRHARQGALHSTVAALVDRRTGTRQRETGWATRRRPAPPVSIVERCRRFTAGCTGTR